MKKTFFPTNNYHALVKSVKALMERDPSLPGLGLVCGQWGRGKTEAIEHFYGESNVYYIEVDPLWNARGLLEGICEEMRIQPEYRTDARSKQVCKELRRRGEPLFIDEADRLLKKPLLLDVVRFIHNKTRVPIILVGMERMYGKLQGTGQFFSRILPAGIVEFQPLSPPEMTLVTSEWCGLDMVPEAADTLCRITEGDFRLVVGYLLDLEKACVVNKTREISLQMVESMLKRKDRKMMGDGGGNIKRLRVAGRDAV